MRIRVIDGSGLEQERECLFQSEFRCALGQAFGGYFQRDRLGNCFVGQGRENELRKPLPGKDIFDTRQAGTVASLVEKARCTHRPVERIGRVAQRRPERRRVA